MTPLQHALQEYVALAYSVHPDWGRMNADAIRAYYAQYGAMGDDSSDSVLSDIVGGDITDVPADGHSNKPSGGIADTLGNLLNTAGNLFVKGADIYAKTRGKLAQVNTAQQIQNAQGQNAIAITKASPLINIALIAALFAGGYMLLKDK